MVPLAYQREASKLTSPILKSPTRPTPIRTLCGAIAPAPAGCPQREQVLPSRTRTERFCFQRRRSWRVPQSPELGDLLLCSVKRQFSSVPVAGCDSATARTLQRLPQSMKQDP
jgi:hypothetical protein